MDATNPHHYNIHPSGVECIKITEHMNFCLGNAIKYIWRAGLKGDAVEDLKKAAWYINREIERLENESVPDNESGNRKDWAQTLESEYPSGVWLSYRANPCA